MVLYRELGPVLWVEAETLVLKVLPENKPGNKPFHPNEHLLSFSLVILNP